MINDYASSPFILKNNNSKEIILPKRTIKLLSETFFPTLHTQF